MDLSVRANLPELMDAEDLDIAVYNRCLSDLAAVNRVTLTHWPTLQFLSAATKQLPAGSKISILDVGCGHGDLLRGIATWAARSGFDAELTGLDLNPRSAQAAAAASRPEQNINYITGNVFGFSPAIPPDFIVTSQFTHHLSDDDIIRLLQWLDETAKRGWHIADLHRHVIPYYGFRLLTRLFGWHRIVRLDGTISIARSFRRADWHRYLAAANIDATISWHPLFRFCVSRMK
jgi:2-polyprenyl-3-methyl-5-hydroxy-6-metoxy-1,4-benzoquinol methylase